MKEIIKETMRLPDGKEPSLFFLQYPALPRPEEEKTKKVFLVDNLIEQTRDKRISWVSHGEDLFIYTKNEFVLALRKSRQGRSRYGYSVFNYILTVADSEEMLIQLDDNDDDYNNESRRRPVMDLYDVVAQGELREIPLAHVCGRQGFGRSVSDRCPACEAGKNGRK